MRKRTWVLYQDLFQHFFLIQDKYTPLSRLRSLSHFVGIFESKQKAIEYCKKDIKGRIKLLMTNLKALENSEE